MQTGCLDDLLLQLAPLGTLLSLRIVFYFVYAWGPCYLLVGSGDASMLNNELWGCVMY